MMNQELEQISEQQKASWNKFSGGWKKNDKLMMGFLKPMGDQIIDLIKPKGNDYILDVAAGTGEPGLTIATMLNGGRVMITDISEDMLAVAREHAMQRGIKNMETRVCDVSALPFPDNTFDAVSCRFGFMFFPDMLLAAKEMLRVLKPGGKIAASYWNGPEKNFWVTAVMSTINRNMQLTPAPDGAPGMFRCAKPGMMAGIFAQAGMKEITEKEVNGALKIGTVDAYWNLMNEVGAPVVATLSKADEEMKLKIKSEVFKIVNEKYSNGNVQIESSANVIYGEK